MSFPHDNATYFIGYTTLHAVRLALEWGLKRVFTGAVQAEFKERLRERFTEGPAAEIASLEQRVRETKATLDRLKRSLRGRPAIDRSHFSDFHIRL